MKFPLKSSERQKGDVIPELQRVGPRPPRKKPKDWRNDPKTMTRPLRSDEIYNPTKHK